LRQVERARPMSAFPSRSKTVAGRPPFPARQVDISEADGGPAPEFLSARSFGRKGGGPGPPRFPWPPEVRLLPGSSDLQGGGGKKGGQVTFPVWGSVVVNRKKLVGRQPDFTNSPRGGRCFDREGGIKWGGSLLHKGGGGSSCPERGPKRAETSFSGWGGGGPPQRDRENISDFPCISGGGGRRFQPPDFGAVCGPPEVVKPRPQKPHRAPPERGPRPINRKGPKGRELGG